LQQEERSPFRELTSIRFLAVAADREKLRDRNPVIGVEACLWLSTLFHSSLLLFFSNPLEISPKGGEIPNIPTAPATKADGKVENQKQVSHFPTASIPLSKRTPVLKPDGFGTGSAAQNP
jgi:hypothetical protein